MEILLKKTGTNLNSRPLADNIFGSLLTESIITVNFEGVESASPSFCHEMFVILKGKEIKIINANENIKLQLRKAMSSLGMGN